MDNRYVLVSLDRATGRVYISHDMLKEPYSKEEVEEIIKSTPEPLKELRIFHVMPFVKAVSLWMEESKDEHSDENKKLLH